jgi:hypothetical protein
VAATGAKAMNIEIRTVPHAQQRYDTMGDWQFLEPLTGDTLRHERLRITVSDLGDWRMEALLAVHELVEALLCKAKGITTEQVDDWDLGYGRGRYSSSDPGADPACPYHREHVRATSVEHIVAAYLGIDWGDYEDRIATL